MTDVPYSPLNSGTTIGFPLRTIPAIIREAVKRGDEVGGAGERSEADGRRPGRFPRPVASGRLSGAARPIRSRRVGWLAWGSVPACARYAPARFTASVIARLAKTRQRCALYSTEPWRSAWTSTPSAAFCAAASIAAASSFLPTSAASTPLARTALVPAPVTATLALTHVPCLSSVTAAQTPTTAKRDAGCGDFM